VSVEGVADEEEVDFEEEENREKTGGLSRLEVMYMFGIRVDRFIID